LIGLGLGLAVNSLLGPFLADVIEYPLSRTLLNQTIGLDAFSLVVVAPLCVLAAVLVTRQHPAGLVFAVALASYAAYMLVQYVSGPAYLEYDPIILFQLALLIVAAATGLTAWAVLDAAELPSPGRNTRRFAILLLALAAFVISRYIPLIAGSFARDPLSDEALDEPTMFWLIVMLDLGAVVPATIATSVALLMRVSWAAKALYAIIGWFALVPPSVAAMGISMVVNDDPNASGVQTTIFVVAAALFLLLVFWVYRPLFVRPARAEAGARRQAPSGSVRG
jgi:hypothetical protein